MTNIDTSTEKKYSKKIAKLFFILSMLLFGTLNFLTIKDMDLQSLFYVAARILPPALLLGCLGHVIGNMLDNSGNKPEKTNSIQKLKY